MNDALLIRSGDRLINRLSVINGNVDLDKITPSIWISQVTDVKRILTKDLYNKVLSDFENDTLSGDYLELFDDYVSNILIFYSSSDFILKNSIMVSNGGNFKHQPENSQTTDVKEVDRLVKYYRDLGNHFEMEFYEWIKDKNIPEYNRGCGDVETNIKNWYV